MTAPAFDTTTFQRLGNKLLTVFTGKLLPVLFLTITMVLYSRKLSYADYGLFQTTWIYINILSVIISFGLSSIILSTNFIHFSRFIHQHRSTISWLYAIGILTGFTIFYFTTMQLEPGTKFLLMAFILLQCICTITDTLFIKHNRLRIYLWMNSVYACLFFLIHLYFYFQPFVLNYLVTGILCLSALKAAFIFLALKKQQELPPPTQPVNFVRNWIYIGLNEISGILARWLDKLFLLYLLSPADFAVFFNGAFEIPLFGILISAMENILLIQISADINNRQAATNIFKESFKLLSLVAFPLFFFLFAMHEEAFAIIFNNKYGASIPVFLVSIFIIPVRITHYGVILQCFGQSGKITGGSVADILLSLLLMFILYPVMGTPGVALAIVISTYLQAGYYVWLSARTLHTSIGSLVPIGYLVKLLLALTVTYGLIFYLKQYVSSVVALVTVFVFTCMIIGGGLLLYWRRMKAATLAGITGAIN